MRVARGKVVGNTVVVEGEGCPPGTSLDEWYEAPVKIGLRIVLGLAVIAIGIVLVPYSLEHTPIPLHSPQPPGRDDGFYWLALIGALMVPTGLVMLTAASAPTRERFLLRTFGHAMIATGATIVGGLGYRMTQPGGGYAECGVIVGVPIGLALLWFGVRVTRSGWSRPPLSAPAGP